MSTEMNDASDNAEDGTEVRFPGATETDNLAADTVLLSGEGEAGRGGGKKVCFGTGHQI
jgi:hypothetical protein